MNNKRSTKVVIIFLFSVVSFAILYIFSELYNESEMKNAPIIDAISFKQEYEKLNTNSDNQQYRVINIEEDNPMIYIKESDLIKKIDNKETFIVYFGYSSCPWCRSIIETFLSTAKNNKVEIIYYVDIKNIRDKYELNDKHKPVKTKEGNKEYYTLLDKLGSVLDDYTPLEYTVKKKKKTVKIKEKRIYAPNIILVKDGVPTLKEDGIPESLSDPYIPISEDIKKEMTTKFNCLFEALTSSSNTCSCAGELC